MQQSELAPYIALLGRFSEGRMGAKEFERAYLDLYLADPTRWSEEAFAVLDVLFADVDAYCGDSALRDERDIDEQELKSRSEAALSKLRTLSRKREGAEA